MLKLVYAIVRCDHGRDAYSDPTYHEEIEVDYGFFTRKEYAEEVVAKHEEAKEAALDKAHAQLLATYSRQCELYAAREAELATLRAAGLTPSLGSLPKPQEPARPTIEQKRPYTTYEVRELELAGREWTDETH